MKIIRNNSKISLGDLSYGDTFSPLNDCNIYIKSCYISEGEGVLCVNIQTGDYLFLYNFDEVVPVECCVSVKV